MITELSSVFGISYKAMLFLFILVVVWSSVWKLMAMWKSAKNDALVWFVVFGLVNTLGILEILYIYVFSKMKTKKKSKKKR